MKLSRRTFATGLVGSSLLSGQEAVPSASPQPAVDPHSAEWKPEFLDQHELETFASLAELIIPATDTPGAREAMVHRHVDRILLENRADVQTMFR
jgi:gluconate 2-dehydrogenase gamma chain